MSMLNYERNQKNETVAICSREKKTGGFSVATGAELAIVRRAIHERECRARTLSVRGLTLAFGNREVLRAIDFDVGEGEIVCLVGPSGCGKTTLLRLLAGLMRPTRGDIFFDGHPVAGPSRSRAIVFQDYANALLPWRTVVGNIALSLEACGVPPEKRSVAIRALLEKWD